MEAARALRFALGHGADCAAAVERAIHLGGRPARLLAPRRPRGTVVAVHGMSPLAEADPRWTTALRGLTAAGFRVVSPRFADIAGLEIHPDQPARVAAAIRAVVEDPSLTPDGEVGLFSVSFSGVLCLHAAAEPTLSGRVRGVCAIGTYGALDGQLARMLGDIDDDPYALLILLANYVERAWPHLEGTRAALLRAARANFADAAADPMDHLGFVSPEGRRRIQALLSDRAVRGDLLRAIRSRCAGDLAALDLGPALRRIEAPVTLLHGADDPVIAASESAGIARGLAAHGHRPRLAITTLISHGDRQLAPARVLREGPAVIGALSGFFSDCARPRHRVRPRRWRGSPRPARPRRPG